MVKPQEEISRSRLNLSEKNYQLITIPDANPDFIKNVYGINFEIEEGEIKSLNVQLLLKPMGVNRKELGRLLKSKFVTNNGTDNIVIQGEKLDGNSIQNDIERVRNLTYDALDRAYWFVRLWRKTNWSIEELDLILSNLDTAGVASGIVSATISALGKLLLLQEKLKISVEELIALCFRIRTTQTIENEKPLFHLLQSRRCGGSRRKLS